MTTMPIFINWQHDKIRIQSTTWGFPSEITTSDASVTAAITKPANPYPAPSSITLLDLKPSQKNRKKVNHTQTNTVRVVANNSFNQTGNSQS